MSPTSLLIGTNTVLGNSAVNECWKSATCLHPRHRTANHEAAEGAILVGQRDVPTSVYSMIYRERAPLFWHFVELRRRLVFRHWEGLLCVKTRAEKNDEKRRDGECERKIVNQKE